MTNLSLKKFKVCLGVLALLQVHPQVKYSLRNTALEELRLMFTRKGLKNVDLIYIWTSASYLSYSNTELLYFQYI